MAKALALVALLLAVSCASAAMFDGCPGTPNNLTLIDTPPKLVSSVRNGQKYTIPYEGRYMYIVVVNGSAYDMGYAYGQLMRSEINEEIPVLFSWFEDFIATNLSSIIAALPKSVKQWIGSTGVWLVQGVLDLNYYITLPYTPARWDEEMQGLADATGQSVWIFRQINLIPELLKASCSIFGAYGDSTSTKKLLHLRTLDWEAHAPQARWPTTVVYHSTEKGSIPFANIAWAGFIGTLTGYNANKVGVGERLKGDAAKDESRFGTPWTYVLRDALQFSPTQPDYIRYLQNAHRTCSVYLGVGGEDYFNICEYTAAWLKVYNWTSWHQDQYHPKYQDVLWKAYHDGNMCFTNIVNATYGNITPEVIYQLMAPLGQTGDSQVVVMDYKNDIMYMAYPNPFTYNPAFNCQHVKVDLTPFFSKQILEQPLKYSEQ